jgi:hypothetical protein
MDDSDPAFRYPKWEVRANLENFCSMQDNP